MVSVVTSLQHAVFKMFLSPRIAGCLELISPNKIKIAYQVYKSDVKREIYDCKYDHLPDLKESFTTI